MSADRSNSGKSAAGRPAGKKGASKKKPENGSRPVNRLTPNPVAPGKTTNLKKASPKKGGASRGHVGHTNHGKAAGQNGPIFSGVRVNSARRAQMLLASLGRLHAQPITSALIVAVVGIALALPVVFLTLLGNLDAAGARSDGQVQASLFLQEHVSDERSRTLANRLAAKPLVLEAIALTRAEALDEFKQMADFDAALTLLNENPLPATIILSLSNDQPSAINGFMDELSRLPEVDVVQLDALWLQRLQAILILLNRAAILVALMLAAAVILVVGTTIGLEIQNRRDEIAVTKLVGGTDAFIRRPFLYSGIWYGLGGGLLAIILVWIVVFFLSGPVNQLAGLYESDYRLGGPSLIYCAGTLLAGAALGVIGSWMAVSRQLLDIQPS